MLAFGNSTIELAAAINGRIDFAPQQPLRVGKGRYDIIQGDGPPHHHDVNVACGRLSPGGHRPVNEREFDLPRQGAETFPQDFGDAEGLANESAEFLENGAPDVGLIVRLPPLHASREDSGACEPSQIALHGSRTQSDHADDLPLIEALPGVAEEQTQQGLPGGAKERRADGGFFRTHYRYNCT
jgi:hypothetical protein